MSEHIFIFKTRISSHKGIWGGSEFGNRIGSANFLIVSWVYTGLSFSDMTMGWTTDRSSATITCLALNVDQLQ